MRRAMVAIVFAAQVAACVLEPYPLPPGPGAEQHNPIRVAQEVRAVVLFIEVRPGDRIELLGAEPVGPDVGTEVRFQLSRPVKHADGTQNIGERLEPLEGAVVTAVSNIPGPDNSVGIVAEMRPERPGRYVLEAVRLRYRLNGGIEWAGEGMSVVWTVCADDPAPVDCPIDPEP